MVRKAVPKNLVRPTDKRPKRMIYLRVRPIKNGPCFWPTNSESSSSDPAWVFVNPDGGWSLEGPGHVMAFPEYYKRNIITMWKVDFGKRGRRWEFQEVEV